MDKLSKLLQDTIMNTGLTAVFSIVYVLQIIGYSKPLAVTAVVILLLNLLYTLISSICSWDTPGRRLGAEAEAERHGICPVFRYTKD